MIVQQPFNKRLRKSAKHFWDSKIEDFVSNEATLRSEPKLQSSFALTKTETISKTYGLV